MENSTISLDVVALIQDCKHISEMVNDDAGASYKSPVIFTGLLGRPRYDITREQLLFWLCKHFILYTALHSVDRMDN